MENSFSRPQSTRNYDAESTRLKFVSYNDNRREFARGKRTRQTSFSISENSSEFSDTATSTTPLQRESLSLCSSESNGDSAFYYNIPSMHASFNVYHNDRIQNRELPPTPETGEPSMGHYSFVRQFSRSSSGHSGDSVKKRSSSRRWWLVLVTIISVVFSVLSLGITVWNLVNRVTPEWELAALKESDYQACVACDHLLEEDESKAQLKSQLTRKGTGSEMMCCATTSGEMSALMQLVIAQRTNITVVPADTKHMPTFSPVSAHKRLHPWRKSDEKESTFQSTHYHLKLNPNLEANREHVRHVTAKNNSLQIQFTGWYFIYASLYFRPATNKPCSSLRHQTWGHFINKLSPNKNSTSVVLVQSAHTCCDNCTDDHHTSYAAGVFLLESGDDVYVDVSGSNLVLYDGEGSYFGLLMLGSWDKASNSKYSGSNNKIE